MTSRPTKLAAIWVGAFAIAIAVGALAHAAPADDSFAQHDDFAPQSNQIGPTVHHTLQWDSKKGRWGLVVDMSQPAGRDMSWSDTRVGLNYRVAPGLRTGVGVSLGSEAPPDTHALLPQSAAPRVRLETTFKF